MSRATTALRPAGPVPVWEAASWLTHTDKMRGRLRGAVHELMGQPGLVGAPDPVRMTTVVLAAKTSAADLAVEMTSRELGRWVGVSASTIGHDVRPYLDREHITESENRVRPGTQVITGIRWQLLSLLDARLHQPATHPLRLQKVEFAVLWGLVEAVCAPGWSHADGTQTPPGLLGTRTGPGAATDRLALLLLVLEGRATGVVRLCSGSVHKHGRIAATIARLLGYSGAEGTAEGARVRGRLEAAGVVEVRRTSAGREQLVIPAVEAAYREMRRLRRAEGRPGGLVPGPRRGVATAGGDQIPAQTAKPQVNRGKSASGRGSASAGLHAYHTPMAALGDEGAGGIGFSGYGRGGSGDLPGRVCAREDQAADTDAAAALGPSSGGPDGPLRGEMPKTPPTIPMQPEGQELAGGDAGASSGLDAASDVLAGVGGRHSGGLRGRVPRPARDLEAVVAPVQLLWDRLKRDSTRRLVEKAIRGELTAIASVVGRGQAESILISRLTRRLLLQPGEADAITDPVGWLLGRGLPRRSDCNDAGCDEGVRMLSGTACAHCEDQVRSLRARRRHVAAHVQAQLPDATTEQQRAALEDQLRAVVDAEAARFEERRRERVAKDAAVAAKAAAARARQEADELARRAMPCAQCGEPETGGLCGTCWGWEETEKLLTDAKTLVAAGCGEPDDTELTQSLADMAEHQAHARIQDACDKAEAAGASATMIALAAKMKAQDIVDEYRTTALRTLGSEFQVEAEARNAHAAQMRRRHLHPSIEDAEQAATKAAEEARRRTAEHLLTQRSNAWRAAHTPAPTEPARNDQPTVYETGAAQARAAVTPAQRPQGAWTCTACGLALIGRPPADGRCAACEGQAAGLSRAERFARLAGAAS
ncbi:hypothetical protein Scani_34150 [Streptomyces caniferus]|uniref:Uncharacterized protein n=1 Tax=Streptomyces caniferus TaxID=285557 RepID=A0A640S7X5_9ACTN|nr:hypothetical protein [Streptomyces caniferus]GFE07147.1 hypothetical protein Scani_34150 [Streptomyces caniferus]